ncbi:MAG: M50 family metallopeptidase [Candidatus Zipacnadales bacterium]
MPESVAAMANTIWAIVFVLGSCIFVHELGHFVAARLAGMRVEEFMIGFPPRLVIFSRRNTRYGIGLVPFGGFCRIAGMEPGQEQVEGGFYTRPRYFQAAVIAAGSLMNVGLAVGLFTLVGSVRGVPIGTVEPPTVDSLIGHDTPARRAGLRHGDVILALDGHRESLKITEVKPNSIGAKLGLTPNSYVYGVNDQFAAVPSDILRLVRTSPEPVTIKVQPLPDGRDDDVPAPRLLRATRRELGFPEDAQNEGQRLADLWGVQFAPLSVETVQTYVMERPRQTIRLTIRREGRELEIPVTPRAEAIQFEREDAQGRRTLTRGEIGQIGITFAAIRRYDVGYALRTGLDDSLFIVKGVADMIYRLLTGQGRFEGSGIVGIAYFTHKQAQIGWDAVVSLCAIINVNLAFINLLPIPIADGGRLVIIGYEAIVRRRISSRREITWLVAGAVFFVVLFAAVTFKDVWNLVIHHTP